MIWHRLIRYSKLDGKCILWTGYCNPASGYGQISMGAAQAATLGLQRVATVPQVVARLVHGAPLPGQEVLHLNECISKACWNPDHLRWGTRAENNHDAWNGGKQKWGEEHHQAKWSDEEVRSLRRRVATGEKAYAVAKEMGMDVSMAYKIVKRQLRTQT